MPTDFSPPVILGHRGAKNYAPENTLAAFNLAIEQGAHGFELDVKLSADGVVVVHHDETVDRTTNGRGWLPRMTFAQLRELDAGSFFSEKFRGEKIPSLEEVFETIGKRAVINVELTNYSSPRDALVEQTCNLIRRCAMQDSIIFSSFSAANLRKAARFLPEVPRGLLTRAGMLGLWGRSFGFNFGNYSALHPHISDVTAQEVRRVHRLKRKINVWTSNLEEDTRRLISWNVDGIITDDPLTTVRVAREMAK